MKFISRYMSIYRKESILAPLLKMLEAVLELLVPFVVSAIIDVGIANRDISYVVRMSLVMILLALLGAAASISAQYFAAKTATGVARRVRADLISTVLAMSKDSYRDIGRATLLTRMTSDVNALQNALNMFLRLFLRSPFIVIGAFIMSMIIDVKLSLIIGAVIVLLSLIILPITKSSLGRISLVQRGLDSLIARIRNSYAGAKVIRGFVLQDQNSAEFEEGTLSVYKRQLGVGRLSNVLSPLTTAFVNMGIIVLIYIGGVTIDAGRLKVGELTALLNYMSQILVELIKIADLIVLLIKGIPSMARIREIIEVRSDVGTGDHVREALGQSGTIVTSVSEIVRSELCIHKGENVGIIGPTGSGKSLMLSLYMDYAKDKSSIGYVPQEDTFFEGTIAENISLTSIDEGEGNESAKRDIDYALNMSGFDDVVKLKGGIDEVVKSDGSNFSVGQRKRLSLARALYGHPDTIIMDDVAAPLDRVTENHIIDNMFDSGMAIIVTSQKVSTVMKADRIIVISNGTLVDAGSHSELIGRCDLYAKMYRAQFPEEAIC